MRKKTGITSTKSGFKLKTYTENIQEVKDMGLEKECIDSLKKVVLMLGKSRVEYMNGGSNTPILKEIYELEKKIHNEIFDLEGDLK